MRYAPVRYYMDEFFGDLFQEVDEVINNCQMKCDIYEKEGVYKIIMDIPGYDKKDIAIEFDNGILIVSASNIKEKNDEEKNYICRERYYGNFSRSFKLGNDIDADKIDAEFIKGILKISIPKNKENSTKKTIEIK